jgi:hypothetical protein
MRSRRSSIFGPRSMPSSVPNSGRPPRTPPAPRRPDAKVGFFQGDEPLEVIILRITCADACFMNGGRYCVLFCHRSPGTHCNGEKRHGIPLDCIKSSIGWHRTLRHAVGAARGGGTDLIRQHALGESRKRGVPGRQPLPRPGRLLSNVTTMIAAFGAGRPRGDREDRDEDATRDGSSWYSSSARKRRDPPVRGADAIIAVLTGRFRRAATPRRCHQSTG